MLINYIIGPAGSGKTTLTHALVQYLKQNNSEISVITINMDPAVVSLPYTPDIDIQDYVTVDQVIQETKLGPNGAIIEATDRMVQYLADIKYEINQYNNPDVVLIDTPGQMELFSFRNTGPMVANALGFGSAQRALTFCYDGVMCQKPNGFISTLLLASSVQFRFPNLPQINVLTKKDKIPIEKQEIMLSWIEDEFALEEAVEKYEKGMLRELTLSLTHAFQDMGIISELTPVSAKFNEDVDTVWGAIQRAMNDDTSPFY